VASNFRESDKKYGTTELKILVVIEPGTVEDEASSVPTTFGVPMETLDSVPGKLQMPQVTSRPGSSHIRPGSRKPQTHEIISSLTPALMPNWSPIQQSKHDEPVKLNPCISRPKLMTI